MQGLFLSKREPFHAIGKSSKRAKNHVEQLQQRLSSIDAKGYKAYKGIKDKYQYPYFKLIIDHVQGDPFAAPTRISLRIPMEYANYPTELWSTSIRKMALEDYLGRSVAHVVGNCTKGHTGTGKSGEFAIAEYGQQILQRNAVVLETDFVEVRMTMGLPAEGRVIASRQAAAMFFQELPVIAAEALMYRNLSGESVRSHVESVEDQEALRDWLASHNLVAFVANSAILPRHSGIDDRPMSTGVIDFNAPDSLRFKVTLPNAGSIEGMGIPPGITLIVGGGFHGKSTLLKALEYGIYDHVPGDGREKVVTDPNAVKIRAEDGRAISKVNISPFINNLPFGRSTVQFFTQNASGSTSQTANIIEAIECGAKVLLIDEDTSATNFMIRDERMRALVSSDREPITPLLHRIRELYKAYSVSSIIVMGGSGDYFDIADTVVMMDTYQPKDVTSHAHALANVASIQDLSLDTRMPAFQTKSTRKPDPHALSPARGHRKVKIDAVERHILLFGEHRVDLSHVEQLINIGQTRSIGWMIYYYTQHYADATDDLISGLEKVLAHAQKTGLDVLSPYKVGNLAMPRLYELAAAINRIRNIEWR